MRCRRVPLSLPVSRSISLSLCLAFSLPLSLSLFLLHSCARPSPSTFTSYTLSFIPARFTPCQVAAPPPRPLSISLSFRIRIVSLVLILATHLASFSRERGGEEGEREEGRQRDLTAYYPAECPVLCFSLLPLCQDTTLSPSVYRLDAHPLSQLSLFFSKQPRWCLFIFSLSLPLSSCLHLFSFSNLPTVSILPKAPPRYVFLSPSRVYPLCVSSPSRFHLRVHPPVFFPARRLLPPYHISLLLLFLQCPSDRSTLFSDSHPVLFLDATLRGSWRAPYPHRGTTGGTCVRSTSIDLFQLTYAPARPGLYRTC